MQTGDPRGPRTLTDPAVERAEVERLRQGDRAAFESIVGRHQGRVFGYLRSRILELADAEDLTQEVFLRFYQRLDQFQSASPVRPWLLGIARNLLREHVRRVRRRREVAWTELCLELDEMIRAPEDGQDDALAHLPGCLGTLGESARTALDLYYGSSFRVSEIGQKLHRSEGAVKLLMFRARQALKLCLDHKSGNGSS
jgi:RNA polymerase sigma-70 factor (ECF subfamily)